MRIKYKPITGYTLVYYTIRKDLNLSLTSYVVLDYIFHSRNNENVSDLKINYMTKQLVMSRNTIKSHINKLQMLGLISNKEKPYKIEINEEVRRRFVNARESNQKYLIIFHEIRKAYNLSITKAGLLYLMYSLRSGSGRCFAQHNFYCQHVNIKKSQYYKATDDLIHSKLICIDENGYMVKKEIRYFISKYFESFGNRKKTKQISKRLRCTKSYDKKRNFENDYL